MQNRRSGGFTHLFDSRSNRRTTSDMQIVKQALTSTDYTPNYRGGGGGGGALIKNNRQVVEYGGAGYGGGDEDQRFKLRFGGGYGYGAIGWMFIKRNRLQVYPLVGIGGSGFNYNLRDHKHDQQQQEHSINADAYFGLGIDIILPIKRFQPLICCRFGLRRVYSYSKISLRPTIVRMRPFFTISFGIAHSPTMDHQNVA